MIPIKRVWAYIDNLVDLMLTAVRSRITKEGLYIEEAFEIQNPYWACFGFSLIFAYYAISIWLILTDVFSFWVLILNCICLVRAIGKTTMRNNKYRVEMQKISKQDCFNKKTRFFLEHNCQAYTHAQKRETCCVVFMLLMAILTRFVALSSFWSILALKAISVFSLLGAAVDDFFSDAAEFYEAAPALPQLAEN